MTPRQTFRSRAQYSPRTARISILDDRKDYSNNQKPWVTGSVNEPASVSLGGQLLAVKGDGTFQGQAPSRTTTPIAYPYRPAIFHFADQNGIPSLSQRPK